MKDDATGRTPEIVIVRRRGGDDGGGGKAGAWKIAYADFVTAMMAFFLVMWLINASNEETRAQVASYFNPIKLTDASTGKRSVKDMKESKGTEKESRQTADGYPPPSKELESEKRLLDNPPEALDDVARSVFEGDHRNAGLESNVEIAFALKPDKSNPGVGDPFDPRSWERVTASPSSETLELEESEVASEPPAESKQLDGDKRRQSPGDQSAAPEEPLEAEKAVGADSAGSKNSGPRIADEAASIAREIAAKLGSGDDTLKESFSVTPTPEGVLVSLTERENFEMFTTGSAEPRQETLRLIEVIADVIQKREGDLVIRGHTDSRPFRNRYYDNWQLSTARAHFARYMLLRGGLDEKRIRRIEGVADREPRNALDPQAAENRRIDILIGSSQ